MNSQYPKYREVVNVENKHRIDDVAGLKMLIIILVVYLLIIILYIFQAQAVKVDLVQKLMMYLVIYF